MPTAASGTSFRGCSVRRAASVFPLALILLVLCCRTAEPPAPPREAVVTWEITPAEGYFVNGGFVVLEYLPPEALPDSPQRPRGGRLVVHLGYLDIRSANTRWYRFEVMDGARRLLALDGEDDIPNVKDPDQYWWNDLDIDLPAPVVSELRVLVTDTRLEAAYPFTLRKVTAWR
jgi:hypothetical protein